MSKTKSVTSGEILAIVNTETGVVVDVRYVPLQLDDEGEAKAVKTALPAGHELYPVPVGQIVKGRLAKDIPAIHAAMQTRAKEK